MPIALVPTAVVRLQIETGMSPKLRALCDTGAQLNLITRTCANRLGLIRTPSKHRVIGVEHANGIKTKGKSTVQLCSHFCDNPIMTITMVIVSRLSSTLPTTPIYQTITEYTHGLTLADAQWQIPQGIDMILNADVWANIINADVRQTTAGLMLQSTKLGWLILGKEQQPLQHNYVNLAAENRIDPITKAIKRLWELDETIEEKPRSLDDIWCETNFNATHYRQPDGRYVVSLPIRREDATLGDSRNMALRRFHAMEKRFNSDPELAAKYIAFMKEYEALGHMKPVNMQQPPADLIYYIPHHAVTKKFRVVFDGSAKTTNGRSLNDIQLPGPKLQLDLDEIVLNFRTGKIAVVADIVKMFRQIAIRP